MNKIEIGNIVSQINFIVSENEITKISETRDIFEELIVNNLSQQDAIKLADRLKELPHNKWTY